MCLQVHGVKVCSEGMGVERHLYSLKCLAEERGLEVPRLLRGKASAALFVLLLQSFMLRSTR